MIVLKATQEKLLSLLQSVCGIVERRHTLPILANVLLRKTGDSMQLTTSDLEIQIRTTAEMEGDAGDFTTTGVTFDSREVGPGDLFVAMTGAATDGHRFLDQAFARGAAGALVSQPSVHPHVLVPDTMAALENLARAARARTAAKIAVQRAHAVDVRAVAGRSAARR